MQLSVFAYHRVLKLVFTIADHPGEEVILPAHPAESFQHRLKQQLF
jgi:predicted ATPase with chaperone activity